jgi:biopolymer transport protein ExbB
MFDFTQSPAVNATLLLLLVFSVVSWFLIFSKGWLQFKSRSQNDRFKRVFWAARSMKEAESAAVKEDGALARLTQTGFESLRQTQSNEKTLGTSGDRQEMLLRNLRTQVQREQHRLESGLMVLASVGSTAPFVGLFGTVWGIMHALKDISVTGAASLEVVSGPVGEALIATAFGIAAAVPAVLAYNWGVRQVRLMVAEMEQFATDFLHLAIKSDFQVEETK